MGFGEGRVPSLISSKLVIAEGDSWQRQNKAR